MQQIHSTLALWPTCTHVDVCSEEFGVPGACSVCMLYMQRLFVLGAYVMCHTHVHLLWALGEHTGCSLLRVHVLGTVGAVGVRVLWGRCVHMLRVCLGAGAHMARRARTCF